MRRKYRERFNALEEKIKQLEKVQSKHCENIYTINKKAFDDKYPYGRVLWDAVRDPMMPFYYFDIFYEYRYGMVTRFKHICKDNFCRMEYYIKKLNNNIYLTIQYQEMLNLNDINETRQTFLLNNDQLIEIDSELVMSAKVVYKGFAERVKDNQNSI